MMSSHEYLSTGAVVPRQLESKRKCEEYYEKKISWQEFKKPDLDETADKEYSNQNVYHDKETVL